MLNSFHTMTTSAFQTEILAPPFLRLQSWPQHTCFLSSSHLAMPNILRLPDQLDTLVFLTGHDEGASLPC
eukprot:1160911-Pelagomonas_calceolata.AAC.19